MLLKAGAIVKFKEPVKGVIGITPYKIHLYSWKE